MQRRGYVLDVGPLRQDTFKEEGDEGEVCASETGEAQQENDEGEDDAAGDANEELESVESQADGCPRTKRARVRKAAKSRRKVRKGGKCARVVRQRTGRPSALLGRFIRKYDAFRFSFDFLHLICADLVCQYSRRPAIAGRKKVAAW
jgi:hypothetical protein